MSLCQRPTTSPTSPCETAHQTDCRYSFRPGVGIISLHQKRIPSLPTCTVQLQRVSIDCVTLPLPRYVQKCLITQRHIVSDIAAVRCSIVHHACCINAKELLSTFSMNPCTYQPGCLTSESFVFWFLKPPPASLVFVF